MSGGLFGSGAVAAQAQTRRLGWTYIPGSYYFTSPPGSNSTGTLVTDRLRVSPWSFPDGVTLDRIGGEVTIAGDVGSVIRLGIYASNQDFFPSALLLDAGTIAGDSVTVQDIPIGPLTLPGGLYWFASVTQNVTTTEPTIRQAGTGGWNLPLQIGTVTPAAGRTVVGYSMNGVSGALPGVWASTTTHGTPFRHHVRVAP